jgi:hypothetical protein
VTYQINSLSKVVAQDHETGRDLGAVKMSASIPDPTKFLTYSPLSLVTSSPSILSVLALKSSQSPI